MDPRQPYSQNAPQQPQPFYPHAQQNYPAQPATPSPQSNRYSVSRVPVPGQAPGPIYQGTPTPPLQHQQPLYQHQQHPSLQHRQSFQAAPPVPQQQHQPQLAQPQQTPATDGLGQQIYAPQHNSQVIQAYNQVNNALLPDLSHSISLGVGGFGYKPPKVSTSAAFISSATNATTWMKKATKTSVSAAKTQWEKSSKQWSAPSAPQGQGQQYQYQQAPHYQSVPQVQQSQQYQQNPQYQQNQQYQQNLQHHQVPLDQWQQPTPVYGQSAYPQQLASMSVNASVPQQQQGQQQHQSAQPHPQQYQAQVQSDTEQQTQYQTQQVSPAPAQYFSQPPAQQGSQNTGQYPQNYGGQTQHQQQYSQSPDQFQQYTQSQPHSQPQTPAVYRNHHSQSISPMGQSPDPLIHAMQNMKVDSPPATTVPAYIPSASPASSVAIQAATNTSSPTASIKTQLTELASQMNPAIDTPGHQLTSFIAELADTAHTKSQSDQIDAQSAHTISIDPNATTEQQQEQKELQSTSSEHEKLPQQEEEPAQPAQQVPATNSNSTIPPEVAPQPSQVQIGGSQDETHGYMASQQEAVSPEESQVRQPPVQSSTASPHPRAAIDVSSLFTPGKPWQIADRATSLPTPQFLFFVDTLFDHLDQSYEPRGTGFLEPGKFRTIFEAEASKETLYLYSKNSCAFLIALWAATGVEVITMPTTTVPLHQLLQRQGAPRTLGSDPFLGFPAHPSLVTSRPLLVPILTRHGFRQHMFQSCVAGMKTRSSHLAELVQMAVPGRSMLAAWVVDLDPGLSPYLLDRVDCFYRPIIQRLTAEMMGEPDRGSVGVMQTEVQQQHQYTQQQQHHHQYQQTQQPYQQQQQF